MLQAWNIQTNAEFSLSAPAGQVHAMEVGNEMLFAGTQVKSPTVLQVTLSLTHWMFKDASSSILYLVHLFKLIYLFL